MIRKVFVDKKEYITRGSEAEIFMLYDGGLFKEFTWDVSFKKRKLKEKRLEYLNQLEKLKKYYPQIRYFVSSLLGICLAGYVMDPICGGSLSTNSYPIEKVLEILGDLRKVLDLFRSEGIYYFDIREPNIIVSDKGKSMLLDIDGVIIDGEKKLDATPLFLDQYLATGGKLNHNAQILMFNLFTRCAFSFAELENDIQFDKEGLEIMQATSFLDSAYDHEYLYEHMKIKRR